MTTKPRILVCGGRNYADKLRLFSVLDELCEVRGWRRSPGPPLGDGPFAAVHVIHGGARGADALAALWARDNFCSTTAFFADWGAQGKAAGAIRNQRMLDEGRPELVVAFPGGRGTADMVRRTKVAKIELVEIKE